MTFLLKLATLPLIALLTLMEWLGIFALGISQFITNKLAVLIFFIVTLGLLTALRGTTTLLMRGENIDGLPDSLQAWSKTGILGLPLGVWTAAAVLAVTGFALHQVYRAAVERSFDQRLDVYLKTIVADVANSPSGTMPEPTTLGDPLFNFPISGWYWQITRTDGKKNCALRLRTTFRCSGIGQIDTYRPFPQGRGKPFQDQFGGAEVAIAR